jgi:hypothetical protein
LRTAAEPLAASLVLIPALAVPLWHGANASLVTALVAMTALILVALASGRLLLRAIGAADLSATAALVVGIAATMLATYALVVALDVLAATAFSLWLAIVAALALIALRGAAPPARPAFASDLVALCCSASATLFWCWGVAHVPERLAYDGVMTTWTDQFIHGAVISQFGDPLAAGRQALELADTPPPLYHYASYTLPAAFARLLELPGLPLATSLWVPVGFLTLCAGIYSLGATLGGPVAGLAALAALTMLPDASMYGLQNRAFGYYWFMVEIPSAMYAVGMSLVAFALLQRWTVTGSRRALAASAALVFALLVVRVHIFLLAFPTWLLGIAFLAPRLSRHRLAVAGAAAAAFALFVFAYYAAFDQATPALAQFLQSTHEFNYPLPYEAWYQALGRSHGAPLMLPLGLLLVFPACLGIFLALYPLSALVARRAGRAQAIDVLPLAMLACYLLLLLTAPVAPNGDATELTHRPFVLLYAVVAVWTCARFVSWLAAQRGRFRAISGWLSLLGAAAFAIVGSLFFTVGDARWDEFHRLTPGLPQAAHYIRARALPGDTLAVQGLDPGPWSRAADPAVQLVSLTAVPAYLSRPYVHTVRGGAIKAIAERRYAELERVAAATTRADAASELRNLGIRWYVVPGSAGPRWDAGRRHAAFVAGQVAVYRIDGSPADEQ